MPVYFACQPSNSTLVKIGHSTNVEGRMQELASSHPDGIELLAQLEGDISVEAGLHKLFEDERVEGEWFSRTKAMSALIEALSGNVKGRRVFGRTRAADEPGSAAELDQLIASKMLQALAFQLAPGVGSARQQEAAFGALIAVNPMWSRRRVRAVWECSARRIELYEVRDIFSLLSAKSDHFDKSQELGLWLL